MIYTCYGKTGIKISKLGLGTNRFKVNGPTDEKSFETAVEIVKKALSNGVNYIDTSYTYSKGMAEKIIAKALESSNYNPHIVVKSAISIDKTADDVLRRIESSLETLNINKATFFLAWTISSYSEYQEIMKKGGYYEGALKARDRGLIDHICFATHCPPLESIKIIEEGAFEGVTLNYAVTNARLNDPVLAAAKKAGIGVTAMSVLGTGMIPKHPDFFKFIRMNESESVSQAALKYVAANPAVNVVLSGASSVAQAQKNIEAFENKDIYIDSRISVVEKRMSEQTSLCTGCGRCLCHNKIPISQLIQSYNGKYFVNPAVPAYRRNDPTLLENIEIFKTLEESFSYMLPNSKNPCDNCKECEKNCPQGISISKTITDLYNRAKASGCTIAQHKERLEKKFKGFKKIGLYPAGGYTGTILKMYSDLVGKLDIELCMFDSNSEMWGKSNNGVVIKSPKDIISEHPDCVVITNYIYQKEIEKQLSFVKEAGIPVIPFHEDNDVPWIY